MKAFLIAIMAMVIITVGADQILETIGFSSAAATTSSENVRLTD